MATLGLVGREQFGNTKKMAKELEKLGWTVQLIDSSRIRLPDTAKFDLLLVITAHMPGGQNRKVKEWARQTGTKFQEISPSWSEASLRLIENKMIEPPKNGAPPGVVVRHKVDPAQPLTQQPFKNIGDKVVPVEEATAPPLKKTEPPAPAHIPHPHPGVETRRRKSEEKQKLARKLFEADPFFQLNSLEERLQSTFGGSLSHCVLKEIRDNVWKERGITEYPEHRRRHIAPRRKPKQSAEGTPENQVSKKEEAEQEAVISHSVTGTEALSKEKKAMDELVKEWMLKHHIASYTCVVVYGAGPGPVFESEAFRQIVVDERIK